MSITAIALTTPQTDGLKRAYVANVLGRKVYAQSKEHCHCCYQTVSNKAVANALIRRGLLALAVIHGPHGDFRDGTYAITPEGVRWVAAHDPHLADWAVKVQAQQDA